MFQLHTLLPGTLSRVLENLAESAKDVSSRPAEVNKIIGQVHVLQLLVNLFNVGHRYVTQCIKLLCITVAIVNGYGAIVHGKEDVVFLLFTCCVTCDIVFFYAFLYEKSFAIPDGFDSVKRNLTNEMRFMRNGRLRKILRRKLESIPSVGLKVGDFHILERESIPIFVDFVLKNIVNLLVTL